MVTAVRSFSMSHLSSVGNLVACAAVALAVLVPAAPAPAQQAAGMRVTVRNPITSDAIKDIQTTIEARLASPNRPRVVVFDFNPDDKPAATAQPGVCSDLAAYVRRLQLQGNLTTVAYVHNKVSGHTVMPVLACQELAMGKAGSLGEVVGEGIEPIGQLNPYRGYFGAEPRFPLVEKMYDPEVQLRRGFDRKTNVRRYADARSDAGKQLGGVEPVPRVPDGQVGLYDAGVAKDLGLSKTTVESLDDLAAVYDLPPSALIDDPLGGRNPEPYRWVLSKDIDGSTRESLGRVIKDVKKKGGNVLILVIGAGGTDLGVARSIADDLRAAQTGDDRIKVVAFIPEAAPNAGTVVALGASEIVMTKPKADAAGDAKEAEIGDFSGYLKAARQQDADAARESIKELAKLQKFPEMLIDGMFKKDLEIVRAAKTTSANRKQLLTREKFDRENAEAKRAAKEGEAPDLWVQDKVIKNPGQLLKLNATLAAELGVARTVEGTDVKAVTDAFGWNPPKDPDPGWLDKFADFLRIPAVTVILVVIGFTGLILELKLPGLTVPGIIAALCFILVFWAHSKFGGQTFVLAMLLFLMGLVLVGIEIFVLPGFGAAGIFGILCMLAGLGLVTLDKIPTTGAEWGGLGVKVSQYMFAMMGAIGLALFIARFLPKLPGANRLILNAPADTGSPADALPGANEAAELLGAMGTSSTPLKPSGVVKFGDKFVDVVSDGGFIPAGTRVQVIQVEGTRIVVKEV